MLFNSFSYLIFFPIVVLLYFAFPHRVRYIWLLLASYFFYMSWNPKYALLIALSSLITYLSGLLIGRENDILDQADNSQALFRKKFWVFLSMLSNLSILFLFKYFYFFLDNINQVLVRFNMEMINPTFDIILPVGISFYTFQALSYTMDVYRKEIYVEKNFFRYALFVSFFPQLVAGPIERSKNLLAQINQRHYFNYSRVKKGLLLMFWGLFLKLVVADRVAILVNTVYQDYHTYQGLILVMATFFFGIQIYCDFYSYSLIAKGSAQVMGFKLMDNFHQPYFSRSTTEFWRRWHISLSTWFRDYLYIPLGGNRKGTNRKYINIMIVFLVSGLWHGASWTFVIWGLLHGSFQVIGQMSRSFRDRIADFLHINQQHKLYFLGQIIFTYLLVNFAWIFFRAPNLTVALAVIKGSLTDFDLAFLRDGTIFNLGIGRADFYLLLISLLLVFIVSIIQYQQISIREKFFQQNIVLRWAISLGLIFSIIILGVYGPGYSASQFIYFQF